MDPKNNPLGSTSEYPNELHPALRPTPILTTDQIREVRGTVGHNAFGNPPSRNLRGLPSSQSVLQQYLSPQSRDTHTASRRARASSHTQASSQRVVVPPHPGETSHPEVFPNFLENVTSTKESRASASKTQKRTLQSFARKFSGPFERRGKNSVDKARKRTSSPPVFDPSPARSYTELEGGAETPETFAGSTNLPKSVTFRDTPKETPSEKFLKTVRRKASRVFSKPVAQSTSPPLPTVVPEVTSGRRASSSYSRESDRSVQSSGDEAPLYHQKPVSALQEYSRIVTNTRQVVDADLVEHDSPTLGTHPPVTIRQQRLRRSKTRRRRSALYDQQRSRFGSGSAISKLARAPSTSEAIDLRTFLASTPPASASVGLAFRAEDNLAVEIERQAVEQPSQLGRSPIDIIASPLLNPFCNPNGDIAARKARIQQTRRIVDAKIAARKNIGYTPPIVPSKSTASATKSPVSENPASSILSAVQSPLDWAKTTLVTYHRQPSFAPSSPTKPGSSKYSRKWDETDFAKSFVKKSVPGPSAKSFPHVLRAVVIEDRLQEQEHEDEKGCQTYSPAAIETALIPSTKGNNRVFFHPQPPVSETPGPSCQVDRGGVETIERPSAKGKEGDFNYLVPTPGPSRQISEASAGTSRSILIQRSGALLDPVLLLEEPASVRPKLSGSLESSEGLRVRNPHARNLPRISDSNDEIHRTLSPSQSLQIFPGATSSNLGVATNPAPRRTTGGKVASLRARFDQAQSSSSAAATAAAGRRPSHSTTGSDPEGFDVEQRDELPSIPGKSVARDFLGTAEPPTARLSAEGGPQVKVTAQHTSHHTTGREEEVLNTPASKEKSPAQNSQTRQDSSYLLQTPRDYLPELVPKPLFSGKPKPSRTPVVSSTPTPNTDTDATVTATAMTEAMDRLSAMSTNRQKAQEDAKAMQKKVIEMSHREGKTPPNYYLMELIGKGSFGRVYKGKHLATAKVVAIKIIDIDASDFSDPGARSNTFNDFMKEINALKIVGETNAKNINNVIEALSVGKTMWMVSEYCGGGSVATLMRPTPRGLKENWIIPILREVAAAIRSVHDAGIVHRDIKCANVLITEDGAVQLCDFGVAGIIENKVDKRTTFIGTPHWMAPELFQPSPSYGKEVDIWAFGSMAFEMATGLPPNARSGVAIEDLGLLVKKHAPRLEGSTYSEGLRSIVAYCLEENPSDRPDIHAVQQHSYIVGTETDYPTSSLIDLVKAFKKWEDHGGSRQSLFYKGGAKGPDDTDTDVDVDTSWNFSTTDAFDKVVDLNTGEQDIVQAYGSSVNLDTEFNDETSKPARQKGRERVNRRRGPPEALAPLKAPIERLFDQNTIHGYAEHSEAHYFHRRPPRPQEAQPRSDLPLREEADLSIVDHIIDIGEHDAETGVSRFQDSDTIRPALSEPADIPNKRATQDWTFPVREPPASASAEAFRFPLQLPSVTPGAGGRPTLHHHPTEPIGVPTQRLTTNSRESLIDLDMSIPDMSRPSTADSSASHDFMADAFHWERHVSLQNNAGIQPREREPSLYIPDGIEFVEQSDFSDNEVLTDYPGTEPEPAAFPFADFDYPQQPPSRAYDVREPSSVADSRDVSTLPPPPTVAALTGNATHDEMAFEMQRMLGGLTGELANFREEYEAMGRGRVNGST